MPHSFCGNRYILSNNEGFLENNKLILKRVDGWGWGHSHHVYFTDNQQFNMQDISFNKNIEKNYIKIKIEKSDLYKKIVKLSVPLNQNTSFETLDNNLNNKFNFTIDNNNSLIVERTDKKEGWNKEFWISINSNNLDTNNKKIPNNIQLKIS